MSQLKLDAERICRVCLREQNELFLIYDEAPVEQGLNIVQILNECTRYTVERYDKMPHQMCAGCIADARAAYRFKRTADEAYRTLVSMLGRIPRKNKDNHVDNGTQTEQSSVHPCEMCNEKLFSASELRQHRSTEHNERNFKCRVCGKVFEQLRVLQLHLTQKHHEQVTPAATLKCKECQRIFSRRDHLVRHMRNLHGQQKSATNSGSGSRNKLSDKILKQEKTDQNLQYMQSENVENVALLEQTEMISFEPNWPHKFESLDAEVEVMDNNLQINPISSDEDSNHHEGGNDFKPKLWLTLEPEVYLDTHPNEGSQTEELPMPASSDRTCMVCNEHFQNYKELCAHLIVVHQHAGLMSKYRCNICQRQFRRDYHLQRHLQTVHKSLNVTEDETSEDDEKVEDAHSEYDAESIGGGDVDEHESEVLEMAIDKDGGSNNTVHVKVEPTLVENTTNLELDSTYIALKHEMTEDGYAAGEESFMDSTQEDVATTENETPEKRSKVKVEIVREYLQKKRTSRKHNNDDNPENRCDLCQRTFSRRCHLLRHKLSHLEQKPHECPHCPKTFARSDHLKAHVQGLHGNKDFKCTLCDAAFSRSDALERHKLSKHDGAGLDGGVAGAEAKVHPCEYCEKKFTSKSYLRKHTLVHTDLLYACKNCDETFKERQKLREHEKTHASERNFLCSICGDSFARNDYLRVHMRRHLGEKPYKCKYCSKGFPRATDVKVHERYHTGTKPNLCTLCGKGFHRAYNLTIHMRTHTGERPYHCDQCPKSFTQSNDLKAHIRRHTGERYKCSECDACFLQLYAMRHHALSVHGKHIESKTGRLQRTGLYDDPNIQPQIITTLVAPSSRYAVREPALSSNLQEQQPSLSTVLLLQQQPETESTSVQTHHSQDSQYATSSITTNVGIQSPVAAPQPTQSSVATSIMTNTYSTSTYIQLPDTIVRFQQSVGQPSIQPRTSTK